MCITSKRRDTVITSFPYEIFFLRNLEGRYSEVGLYYYYYYYYSILNYVLMSNTISTNQCRMGKGFGGLSPQATVFKHQKQDKNFHKKRPISIKQAFL